MDYERKYKEAIELMKDCIPDADGLVHVRPQEIFPELKESEDEKTKRILHSISSKISFHLRDIFTEEEFQCFDAWLERQGEQKSVIEMKTPEESLGIDSETYNKIVDECIYGEQKPADKVEPKTTAWKPSDEQLKALKEACDEHWEPDGLDPLYTLYQDLKKLMEEKSYGSKRNA